MTILGVDISHFQGAPNFAQVKASGRDFIVIKATEGVGYTDPRFAANRSGSHAAGLIVLLYAFGRGGNPVAEADYFLSVVGSLQVGEGVVLDDEVAGIGPAWVKAWCDRVFARTTVKPLVYMNQNARDTADWSSVVADNDGLWLAKYDLSTAPVPGGAWGSAAMKQYTDRGVVAGIAGGVDLDVFYGTDAQLLKYGLQPPAPAPAPPPAPPAPTPAPQEGYLMALSDAQQLEVYNITKLIGTQILGQTYLADGQWGWPTSDGQKTTVVDMLRGLYPPKPAPSVDVNALAAELLAALTPEAAKTLAGLVLDGIKAQMAAPLPGA